MADLLKVTTAPGAPAVLDLADGTTYSYVPDTLRIDITGIASTGQGLILEPGAGYTTASDERYGGANVDFDRRPNGVLQWTAVVRGTPHQSQPQATAALAAEIERVDPAGSRFIEWRRDGAANSLYYERRGPGVWDVTERWEFGDPVAQVTVQLPVAPVAYGPPSTVTLATANTPNVWALPAPGGPLPAKMDVQLVTVGGAYFGLLAGTTAPFGIYNASDLTAPGWTLVVDPTARGGSRYHVPDPSGNTNYFAYANIDPSTAWLDSLEYEQDLLIEVWARLAFDGVNLEWPTVVAAAKTPDGAIAYPSLDFGGAGKQVINGRFAGHWGLFRMGTVQLPPDPGDWVVGLQIVTPAGGLFTGGDLALDYLMLVPARHRACSPTGVAGDSAYPLFTPSVFDFYTKVVYSDLSAVGKTGSYVGAMHQDRGLGGAPLRCPPSGSPLLMVAESPAVPDDPTNPPDDAPMSVTPTVTLTPRYRLLDTI